MTGGTAPSLQFREVTIAAGSLLLPGVLGVPAHPRGLVVIASWSPDGRQHDGLAVALHDSDLATLQLRLGPGNATGRTERALVAALTDQVLAAADWASGQPALAGLALGVFGSELAGAVALTAAARRPCRFRAVVSRTGRPDLAADLDGMETATLLIAPGQDDPAVAMHLEAMARVRGIAELEILPGPSARPPGDSALADATTRRWFTRFLG